MIEQWKPIKDFEEYYEVSNLGRVKSLTRLVKNKDGYRLKKEKIKTLSKTRYLQVGLNVDNVSHTKNVHILVAQVWLSNPLGLPEVNHIDGNKWNNCSNNLEFCDEKYNSKHARTTGLCNQNGEDSVNAKFTNQQVLEIRALKYSMLHQDIAKKYGVSIATMSRIMNNKSYVTCTKTN